MITNMNDAFERISGIPTTILNNPEFREEKMEKVKWAPAQRELTTEETNLIHEMLEDLPDTKDASTTHNVD